MVVKLLLTIVAASVGTTLTDWLFQGVLFHEKYKNYPEVWRNANRQDEQRAVIFSIGLGLVTCAAFVFGCIWFDLYSYTATLRLALMVWLIAPLPLIITNALFLKLHPLVAVSHTVGWLVKLCICALCVVWILPKPF